MKLCASGSSLTLQILTCFIIFTVAVSEFASGTELTKNVVDQDGSIVVAVDKLKETFRKGHNKRDAEVKVDDTKTTTTTNGVKRETVAEVAELVQPEDGQKGQAPSLEITYRVTKSSKNTPREAIDSILRKAFDKWEEQADVAFVPKEEGDADIDIRFESGEHADHEAFDGKGGIAAHAFKSKDGTKAVGAMHFDDGDDWTEDSLLRVSSFEIGKLLQILQRKDFDIEETTVDAEEPEVVKAPAPVTVISGTSPAPAPTSAAPAPVSPASVEPIVAQDNSPYYPAVAAGTPYQNLPPPGIGYGAPYSSYGDPYGYGYGFPPAYPGAGYGYGLYDGYYPPGAFYGSPGLGLGFGIGASPYGYGYNNLGYGGSGLGFDTFYWKNYSPSTKFSLNTNDVGQVQGIYGSPNSNWLANRHQYRQKFGNQFSPASRLAPPAPVQNVNGIGYARPVGGFVNQHHNFIGAHHNGHFNNYYNPYRHQYSGPGNYGFRNTAGNFGGGPAFQHHRSGFAQRSVLRGSSVGFGGGHGTIGGRPPHSGHGGHRSGGHRG